MQTNYFKSLSLFSICILIIAACNYYKVVTLKKDPNTAAYSGLDSLQSLNRYFILQSDKNSFHMKDIKLNNKNYTVSCILETLPADHQFYFSTKNRAKKKYSKSNTERSEIINEVHFYTSGDAKAVPGAYELQLSQVQKIEVIQHDKKRTTNSYVIGTIGSVLGAAVLTTIIILATKSSCPFVSAYDGNDFSLQGEIFGGAIYPQLSRKDYLPLRMAPFKDGSLQVKISNELKERQYTDLANLWVISHPKNSRVAADEKGNLYSISQPEFPVFAMLNQKNVLNAVMANDRSCVYMDDTLGKNALNEITLRFKKPLKAKQAKLILRLKNTYFLDLLYGEMAMNMGTYYNHFVQLQKKKSANELLKWVNNQNIPLSVNVHSMAGWERQSMLTTVGPLAFRETVIPLDLSSVYTNEVEIKLSSGFMFWEIDYTAIDYTANDQFEVEVLTPEAAVDETNRDVRYQLGREDGIFLSQPEVGNVAALTYRKVHKADTSLQQSYVLETKGYYEHVRNFQHEPDFGFLKQFRKPGRFPAYGLQLYKKINSHSVNSLAGIN